MEYCASDLEHVIKDRSRLLSAGDIKAYMQVRRRRNARGLRGGGRAVAPVQQSCLGPLASLSHSRARRAPCRSPHALPPGASTYTLPCLLPLAPLPPPLPSR